MSKFIVFENGPFLALCEPSPLCFLDIWASCCTVFFVLLWLIILWCFKHLNVPLTNISTLFGLWTFLFIKYKPFCLLFSLFIGEHCSLALGKRIHLHSYEKLYSCQCLYFSLKKYVFS